MSLVVKEELFEFVKKDFFNNFDVGETITIKGIFMLKKSFLKTFK